MTTRRDFATLIPALLAAATLIPTDAEAQFTGPDGKGKKPSAAELKEIVSGTYKPGPGYGSLPKRISHRYLIGSMKAGNLEIEIHETIQEVGALHEPVDTHKHNEIWLVREGTVELTTNGVGRRMVAGDVGVCIAGDEHYIKNIGDTQATYFVVTVGAPE